jgi:membrane associated rhomboid family serine protease
VIPIRDENPTARRAIVTILLIVVNVAIYFGIQFPKHNDANADALFEYRWAGVPCEVHTGKPVVFVPEGAITPSACAVRVTGISEPHREFPDKNVWLAALLFSMFLHGSVLHVLGNMLFLWIFGNNVEDQLGPVGFLALYLVGGIVASLAHIVGNIDSTTPFLGASGAIAVVMGAYIVWFPRARVLTLIPIVLIFWPVRLPAIVVLGLWFVLQFLTQSSSGIATLAHIGGFVFGMLVAYVLAQTAGYPRAVGGRRLDY